MGQRISLKIPCENKKILPTDKWKMEAKQPCFGISRESQLTYFCRTEANPKVDCELDYIPHNDMPSLLMILLPFQLMTNQVNKPRLKGKYTTHDHCCPRILKYATNPFQAAEVAALVRPIVASFLSGSSIAIVIALRFPLG